MEWSYKYVQEQHKKMREQREQIARKCVESWLEHLIRPHLATAEPLPESFVSGNLVAPDDLPDAMQELAIMATKLGWHMVFHKQPDTLRMRVEVAPSKASHLRTDSVWDIDAVRAKKLEVRTQRTKVAADFIREALHDVIGRPCGVPDVFSVGVTSDILEIYRNELAELGWQPTVGTFGRPCVTKLDVAKY